MASSSGPPPLLDPYGELHASLASGGLGDAAKLAAIRKKLVWAYSWAVPSREAIAEIARHSPIVEIGAGTGYWAWLLGQAGADVLAFDRNAAAPPRWFDVREGGPEALDGTGPRRALFLCWPPLDEPLALDCLERYRGGTVLYLGEEGRTGSAGFHERLRAEWRLQREIEVPRWPGCGDSLRVYGRGQEPIRHSLAKSR